MHNAGGVAMFTRSLAHLGMGIRVNSLCPEYVETPLLEDVPVFLRDYFRDQMGFVKMERILEGKSLHYENTRILTTICFCCYYITLVYVQVLLLLKFELVYSYF